MTTHHNLSRANRHAPISFAYADETEREAASDLIAEDVEKFARQLNDNSVWMLIDHDPVTWEPAGGGGSGLDYDPDPYGIHHNPNTPHADDDEFDTNSIADWTAVTQSPGSINWVIANGVLSCLFSGQSGNEICALVKPVTLADGEWWETHVRALQRIENYSMLGLVVTDGDTTTSNACAIFTYINGGGNIVIQMWTGTLASMGTGGASYQINASQIGIGLRLRLKRVSSSSFIWEISTPDGVQFSNFGTAGVDPGFTPTHAGFLASVWGGALTQIATYDFFRHKS